MTDPNKTLIAALLDRSGSMSSIVDDMCGGFDSYIAAERSQPGSTLVTLAQFDGSYDVVYSNEPIAAVPPLELQPRGRTALLDAIGRFITDVGAGLARLPEGERPGDVTVLVLTDGHENASVQWSRDAVKELINQQETVYGWDFVFLGANMDAVDVGTELGFAPGKSLTYAPAPDAVAGAWHAVSSYSARKRARPAAPAASIVFDDAERSGAQKR